MGSTRSKWIVVLLALLLSPGLLSSPVRAQSYSVRGVVTDLGTGSVVSGALVMVTYPATGDTLHAGAVTVGDGSYDLSFDPASGTGVAGPGTVDVGFTLHAPYPNPARGLNERRVTIPYSGIGSDGVVADVFDVVGRRFDSGGHFAPGLYFFRLRTQRGRVSNVVSFHVTEPGPLELVPVRTSMAGKDNPPESARNAAASPLSVRVVVTAMGYERTAVDADVEEQTTNEVDVALSTASSELTVEERQAAFDALAGVGGSGEGPDAAGAAAEVEAFLRTRSEFSEVGVASDHSLWARFRDGRLLFIANAMDLEVASKRDNVSGPLAAADESATAFGARPGTRTVGAESENASLSSPAAGAYVPTIGRALLLQGVSSLYRGDPRSKIASKLEDRGYVVREEDASLPVLRAVAGNGVLFINTHSANTDAGGGGATGVPALFTTTAVDADDEADDPLLVADLAAGRVGYMTFLDSKLQEWGVTDTSVHYGITESFIREYWRFPRHSFVFLAACNTSVAFSGALRFAGASVTASWTQVVRFDVSYLTAEYVFDKLLGTGEVAAAEPKNRPFPWSDFAGDPLFGATANSYGWSVSRAGTNARLVFNHLQDDFRILAPTIEHLEVNEADEKLKLIGLFGDDPGADLRTIEIDGDPVDMASWSPTEIEVDLPESAHGDVVVTVRDHESNAVPLTRWETQMTYTVRSGREANLPDGTFVHEVECDAIFRADVHRYRTSLNGPLTDPTPQFSASPESECTWKFSGSGTDDNGTTATLTGGGTIPWSDPRVDSGPTKFSIYGDLDPAAGTGMLHFFAIVQFTAGGMLTFTDQSGSFSIGWGLPVQGLIGLDGVPIPVVIHLDPATYAIGETDFTITLPDPTEGFPVRLEWTRMEASEIPSQDTFARRAELGT